MGIAFDPSKRRDELQRALDQAGRLNVALMHEFDPTTPTAGHARGKIVEAFSADQLRGVPILGLGVGGAVNGTRPGDSASELERAGRELVRAHLNRNRFKRP